MRAISAYYIRNGPFASRCYNMEQQPLELFHVLRLARCIDIAIEDITSSARLRSEDETRNSAPKPRRLRIL